VGELALIGRGSLAKKRKDSTKSTAFYRTLIPLINHLGASGPVLVVESTRADTVRMAAALASAQPERDRTSIADLVDLVVSRLGAEHPLVAAVRKGVGYHHGSLPSEIRAALEAAVIDGSLNYLVATTTMTEGVNLPVRSVVVASQGSYGPSGYTEYISGAKLINAIGRAGRAARETEGIVVLARHEDYTNADFARLDPETADTTVRSSLVTERALHELAEFEEIARNTADAVFLAAGDLVSGFLSFVWFVVAEREKRGATAVEEEVEQILASTLGWVQMTPPIRQRWLSVARSATAAYLQAPPSTRRRWAAAGIALPSGFALEALANEVALEWKASKSVPSAVTVIEMILSPQRVERLMSIKEAPKRRIYTGRGGSRVEVAIPIANMLRAWLSGAELQALAGTFLADVTDIEFRFEQLGDYISDYFENFLPWALGVVVGWANSKLEEGDFSGTLIPGDLPAYIRYGVDSTTAIRLLAGGLRSRGLARRLAKAWDASEDVSDVRTWLASLAIADWERLFQPSLAELRSLVDFARSSSGAFVRHLLDGEPAVIAVHPSESARRQKPRLSSSSESTVTPIQVIAGEESVGPVPSGNQADIHSLLAMGFAIETEWVGEGTSAQLELRLAQPSFA
jgi:hypothetical protein